VKTIFFRDAIYEALQEEMHRDKRVFIIGEDVAEYGGPFKTTKGLLMEFGKERVRNTPISESAIVGAALGASIVGMRPVVDISYIDFTMCCADQIINQVAKIHYMTGGKARPSLVIRTEGGAGRSSAAQHAQSLEAIFMHIPGLYVVMPSTPYDAKGLLKSAIRNDNPVMFIEHKLLYNEKGEVPEGEYLIPLGKADVKRAGTDVTVVATSRMVKFSLEAAADLEKEGVSAEVIDPRSLVPLDEETILNSVRKTHRLTIVHEACKRGGFGAELAAVVAERGIEYLDAPIIRVAAADTPVPFSPVLENFHLPDKKKIIDGIRRTLE
jgi:pyruvate/2-oxoglutarate/acetoin dehydrogenase E1 component